VNIFDADGRFLNSSERWPVPHADLSDRNFFKTFKLEADSPPVLIQRVDSRLSKGSTIVVARKVASSDGLFLGMVTRSISPEKFEAFFSAISLPDIALAMLHRDGPLLARYPHFDETAAKDLFDSPPDIQASADGYATVESQSFVDDKDNLAAEGSLEHYPIYVVATKLRSSVLASWNQQNRTVIMDSFTFFIALLYLLYTPLVWVLHRYAKSADTWPNFNFFVLFPARVVSLAILFLDIGWLIRLDFHLVVGNLL